MSRTATHRVPAGAVVALVLGCGGGGDPGTGPPPPPPPTSVLSSVLLDPPLTVYSTPPGNAFTLTVTLKDQNGSTFIGSSSKSFSSGNTAVATVSSDGTITGVTVGSAQVTATVQAGGVTRTGTTTVTVQEPGVEAYVETHEVRFDPTTVHVSRGGSVTWLIGRVGILIPHNVIFGTQGAPADIPLTGGGVLVSRLFPTPGSFVYSCTVHSGMVGTVHVH